MLIFSGDLVCSLQLGVSKESRVTLTSVYTPREQGIYPWRVSGDGFVQVERGKKVGFFGHCMHVCSILSKKARKGHRCSFARSSACSLHFKPEDYIG